MRVEFGFHRTNCACDDCQLNCRVMPGFLIPSDLQRMIPEGADPFVWAKCNLLASPGARVLKNGRVMNVQTLVPAVKKEDRSCINLVGGRCAIHAIAPFGCAFFDCKQSKEYADSISANGLVEIIKAWRDDGLYARLWKFLDNHGRKQKSADVLRARMQRELNGGH